MSPNLNHQPASPKGGVEQNDQLSLFSAVIKTTFLTFSVSIIFSLLTVLAASYWIWGQVNVFTNAAGTTPTQMYQLAKTGWNKPVIQTGGHKNVLLLGVDKVANREGHPVLTDTMILLSLNTNSGEISAVSLPRDLWSADYQTKINALYSYGDNYYPGEPHLFTQEVMMDMTQVPIHHTLVLSLEQVARVVDLVGGIEVDVLTGFTDDQFPRSDVDIAVVSDPALLYETVAFETGFQSMDSQTALKFIRSRYSNSDEGNDQARSARQQLVITSLISKVTSEEVLTNPKLVGELYAFYTQNYSTSIEPTEIIAILKLYLSQNWNIAFNSQPLAIYPEDKTGVIFHPPPESTQNLWVYQARDDQDFANAVRSKLKLPATKDVVTKESF
jgi:LCP family protein required for cell wall assembly